MDQAEVSNFAENWLRGWNEHDLDQVLSHFADDVTFTSPVAAQLLDSSDGVIRGKPALPGVLDRRAAAHPNLRFELVGVYVGLHTIVINYRNQRGGLVNEVLTFAGPLVVQGHGTYLGHDTNPAGAAPR